MKKILCIFALYLLFSCFQQAAKTTPVTYHFLGKNAAKEAITKDDKEGFFEKITTVDICLQLKVACDTLDSAKKMLPQYKELLESDVLEFSAEDKAFVQAAMNQALYLTEQVLGKPYQQQIGLIKSAGLPYSSGTFYTREQNIVIPKKEIELADEADFLETMLHEIFHIYSRYSPEKRQALYALIGFGKLNQKIQTPTKLTERILQNPDGIDTNYYIELTDKNDRTFKAVPLIYAKESQQNTAPGFFGSLEFQLFEIITDKNSKSTLKTTSTESIRSPINLEETNFYQKIGPNTDYIIHPDEILADNFAILALAQQDKSILEELEPAGQDLIKKMAEILKK